MLSNTQKETSSIHRPRKMQRKARHIRSGIMNSGERVFLGSEAVRVEAKKKKKELLYPMSSFPTHRTKGASCHFVWVSRPLVPGILPLHATGITRDIITPGLRPSYLTFFFLRFIPACGPVGSLIFPRKSAPGSDHSPLLLFSSPEPRVPYRPIVNLARQRPATTTG